MQSLSCPTGTALRREKATLEPSFATAFARPHWESVVVTSARLVERRSARQPGHLIIDSNTVAPASLSVEGVNKSAIARAKRIVWNTVHRWLEKAAAWCRRFNHRKVKGLSIPELQADEIRTIIGAGNRRSGFLL
jgi:hypothetical protein